MKCPPTLLLLSPAQGVKPINQEIKVMNLVWAFCLQLTQRAVCIVARRRLLLQCEDTQQLLAPSTLPCRYGLKSVNTHTYVQNLCKTSIIVDLLLFLLSFIFMHLKLWETKATSQFTGCCPLLIAPFLPFHQHRELLCLVCCFMLWVETDDNIWLQNMMAPKRMWLTAQTGAWANVPGVARHIQYIACIRICKYITLCLPTRLAVEVMCVCDV